MTKPTQPPLLSQKQVQQLHQQAEKAVADYIEKLPAILRDILNDSVMSAIGFSRDGFRGHYTVDCCNGRSSMVSDFITEHARKLVREVLSDLIVAWTKKAHADQKYKDAMEREFQSRYERTMREEISQQATALAKQDAHTLMTALMRLRLAMPVINTELADPNSFQGILGEAMLNRLVESGMFTVQDAIPAKPDEDDT